MNWQIAQAAVEVCQGAAEAAQRYAKASGMCPMNDMPEYFLGSITMDMLRGRSAATLETRIGKLWDFERDNREENEPKAVWEAKLTHVINNLKKRPKVDLVLYKGDPSEPQDATPFAIVEFKKGYLDMSDRSKIKAILNHITCCSNGIICSLMYGSPEDFENEKLEAEAQHDGWISVPVGRLPHNPKVILTACARHFGRDLQLSGA